MLNNRFCSILRSCVICSQKKSNDIYKRVRFIINVFILITFTDFIFIMREIFYYNVDSYN